MMKDEVPIFMELGNYTYDINGSPTQIFIQQNDSLDFPLDLIRFEILSNYGEEQYTCLYRVRVHGIPQK